MERETSSFNHSYICNRLLQQLFSNDKIEALPELTLNIEKGLTPDISIYPKEQVAPDFLDEGRGRAILRLLLKQRLSIGNLLL